PSIERNGSSSRPKTPSNDSPSSRSSMSPAGMKMPTLGIVYDLPTKWSAGAVARPDAGITMGTSGSTAPSDARNAGVISSLFGTVAQAAKHSSEDRTNGRAFMRAPSLVGTLRIVNDRERGRRQARRANA